MANELPVIDSIQGAVSLYHQFLENHMENVGAFLGLISALCRKSSLSDNDVRMIREAIDNGITKCMVDGRIGSARLDRVVQKLYPYKCYASYLSGKFNQWSAFCCVFVDAFTLPPVRETPGGGFVVVSDFDWLIHCSKMIYENMAPLMEHHLEMYKFCCHLQSFSKDTEDDLAYIDGAFEDAE